MQTLQVGDFKAQFSKVLKELQKGEEFVISYGKKKEKVAVLIPFDSYRKTSPRKLGILKDKGSFSLADDFKLTDEEFLES